MNDGRDLSFGAFLGSLGVGTTLFAAFLSFFLCAVAPAAGTWVLLRQQVPLEQPSPAEEVDQQESERGAVPAQSFSAIHGGPKQIGAAQTTPSRATARWTMETLTQLWGGAVLVLMGLGGTLLYLLWQHVVVPLKRLKREAISVAGGAPGTHLTVPAREDEIGMLARALRHLKTQADSSGKAAHTASQNATATLDAPAVVRLDNARRVAASNSVSVTYGGSENDSKGATATRTDWTVSTEEVRPLSAYAARGNGEEPPERSSLPLGDETEESETGVRYDEFMAVIHPADRNQLRNRQDQAIENGVPIDIEYRIVSPDGKKQVLRERGTVKMGKDGSPARFSGHVLDVTEQKANEQEIERLQKDYNQLLSSLPDAMIVVEAGSSTIVEANDAAASLFGTTVDELLGRNRSFFYPTGAGDQFAALFEAARHNAPSVPDKIRRFPNGTPLRIVTDAGDEVPVALALTPVERADQTFFVAVLSDNTKQRSTRTRLRTFERAVEQSDDMIAVLDANGTVRHVNSAAESITGYDRDALVEHPPPSMQLEEIEARNEQKEETPQQEEAFRDTLIDERKNGSTVVLDQIIAPVHDATGTVSHYVLTGRDITKRVEREEELHRRAEALREQEARLRGLTNSIPGVVYQFYVRSDGTRGLHFVSKHAEPTLGIPPDSDDFLETLIEHIPASHRDALKTSIDEAVEHQESWSFEFPYEHPSGERMWLLGSSTPEPNGDELLFNGLLLDITDRKRAERASAEERDRFVTLFESLPSPVLRCELTPDGTLITNANEAFKDTFGAAATMTEGGDLNNLIVPEDEEAEAEQIERHFLDDGTQQFEVKRQTTDGMRDFRLQAAGRTSESDSTELYAIYTDITERKEREQTLQAAKRRYQTLVENFPDGGVFLFDENLQYKIAGGEALDVLAPHEEMIGATVHDFLPEELAKEQAQHYRRALEGNRNDFVQEYQGRHFHIRTLPVRSETGEMICGMVVVQDITERKEQERELERARLKFQRVFEESNSGIFITDIENDRIVDCNQAAADLVGISREKLQSLSPSNLHPHNPEAVKEWADAVLEEGSGRTEKITCRRLDGEIIPVEMSAGVAEFDGTRCLVNNVIDITERKEREKRLRGRRRKIESLYAGTSHLPAAEHPESVFARVHKILQEVLDYTFTATGFVEENRIIFENTATKGESPLPAPAPALTASDRGAARALRTGETVVVANDVGSSWETNEVSLDSVANIPVGEHGVITIGQTEDTTFDSFDLRLTEILGTYAAVVLDRLEHEQELRAAKEEAEDASEFKSVMLANISHEIRTPLTAINGFSEVLTEELDPPHVDLAERVHEGGKRLLNTFDSVLKLSQLEAGTHELDPGRCALDQIVRGKLNEWKEQAAKHSISLDVHIPNSSIEGMWDAKFVGEIVENLWDNAIKFTPSGGEVSIRVRDEDGHAVFEIEDTGIGIGEQFRQDMFQAFKQESEGLTREYEGAGVGLAVTEKAVDRMGGCIDVESVKGEGSCFVIRLPKEQQ